MKVIFSKLKTVCPWLIAAAIFAYLFHKYPPAKVWQSLTYVNLLPFLGFSLFYFFFIYVIDAAVTGSILTKFTRKVALKDVVLARGVTYLIMVISYPASQAAFAYYFKRRYKIPIFEVLSTFLFIMFVDLWWIVTLAFVGSFFQDYTIGDVNLSRLVFTTVMIFYGVYIVWLAFWRRWPDKGFWEFITPKFIERQRKREIFDLFAKATMADYLRTAVMRIPIHFTIIISFYVVIRTFGCNIPFVQILSNVPIVFLIGTLPITPGGLGTTNALLVELLKGHLTGHVFKTGAITPAELIFSATLLWMFVNYLLKVITGTILMGFVSRKLFEPTEDMPEDVAEKKSSPIGGNL
jgi:uncharacterized membrane protein YbhN (UPF0104 family)